MAQNIFIATEDVEHAIRESGVPIISMTVLPNNGGITIHEVVVPQGCGRTMARWWESGGREEAGEPHYVSMNHDAICESVLQHGWTLEIRHIRTLLPSSVRASMQE